MKPAWEPNPPNQYFEPVQEVRGVKVVYVVYGVSAQQTLRTGWNCQCMGTHSEGNQIWNNGNNPSMWKITLTNEFIRGAFSAYEFSSRITSRSPTWWFRNIAFITIASILGGTSWSRIFTASEERAHFPALTLSRIFQTFILSNDGVNVKNLSIH